MIAQRVGLSTPLFLVPVGGRRDSDCILHPSCHALLQSPECLFSENVFHRGEGQVIRDGNTVLDSNDEDDALISDIFVIFTSL